MCSLSPTVWDWDCSLLRICSWVSNHWQGWWPLASTQQGRLSHQVTVMGWHMNNWKATLNRSGDLASTVSDFVQFSIHMHSHHPHLFSICFNCIPKAWYILVMSRRAQESAKVDGSRLQEMQERFQSTLTKLLSRKEHMWSSTCLWMAPQGHFLAWVKNGKEFTLCFWKKSYHPPDGLDV